jgi:hypothetical protein
MKGVTTWLCLAKKSLKSYGAEKEVLERRIAVKSQTKIKYIIDRQNIHSYNVNKVIGDKYERN